MRNVTVNSIGEYIREQREQAKISMRQLAQTAGASNPYLRQIAKGLRVAPEALYVQAGILEDRPADSGVRSALLTDPELSERQKQVLIEIYESFRRENVAASESAQAEAAALDAGDSALADGAPGAEAFLAQMATETATEPAPETAAAPQTEAGAAAAYTPDAEAADAEAADAGSEPGISSQAAPTIRPDSASD